MKEPRKNSEIKKGRYWHQNFCQWEGFEDVFGEGNIWKILVSTENKVEGEVDDIEGRGTYHMIRVKEWIYLIPPDWHRGNQVQSRAMGYPIRGQGGSKEEEGRGLLVW